MQRNNRAVARLLPRCQFHQRFARAFLYESLRAAFVYLLLGFEFLAPIFCTKNARIKQ